MEQKTFIEASATYWRKMFFEASTFEGLQVVSIKNKKNENNLVVYFLSFAFLKKRQPNKYYL